MTPFVVIQVWSMYEEPVEKEEVIEDSADRNVNYKQIVVTEVSPEDLKFNAQYVDNGKQLLNYSYHSSFNRLSVKSKLVPKGQFSSSVFLGATAR